MKKVVYEVVKYFGDDGEYISGKHQFETLEEAREAAEKAAEHYLWALTDREKKSRYNGIHIDRCVWSDEFEEYQYEDSVDAIIIK